MWADYNLHFAVSLGLTELSFPLCLFLRGNSTQADSTTMPWRTNVGTPFGDVGEEHDTQASPGDRSEHLTGDWDTSLVDDIGSLWIKFQLHMVMEWTTASFSIW